MFQCNALRNTEDRTRYFKVDAAYCYWPSGVLCRSVGLLVCQTSEHCKTSEPIKLPFGLWAID